MRVAFRTDSSAMIGSGHLIRCLTLANELRSSGCEIVFITRDLPGHLIFKLEEAAYGVYRLPQFLSVEKEIQACLTFLQQKKYDWLVVDHYGLDATWEKQLRFAVKHILVIDDLANRKHDCDILLDQNFFKNMDLRYRGKLPAFCKTLLGPYYALLQPEYVQCRRLMTAHQGQVNRVLIFFGSSDSFEQTGKVLSALSCPELAYLEADVVIGANYPNPKRIVEMVASRPRTTLYQNQPSLAKLMMNADFVIGAGGATTWERMCLGRPSLVISLAENQYEFTCFLREKQAQFMLASGTAATVLEWQQALDYQLKQSEMLIEVARNARNLVDGLGVKRIVRSMLDFKANTLVIRKANKTDEAILFHWVNEPEVRKQSFQQKRISELEHSQWFASKLKDPNCLILIGEDENGLVGQVRFEINRQRAEAVIDISIDHTLRGMGYAEQLFNLAKQYFYKYMPKCKLIAEVRWGNQPSQKLFTKLQFLSIPSQKNETHRFVLNND